MTSQVTVRDILTQSDQSYFKEYLPTVPIDRLGPPGSREYRNCGRSGSRVKTEHVTKHPTYAVAPNPVVMSAVTIYNMGRTHDDTAISLPDATGSLQYIACIPWPTVTV